MVDTTQQMQRFAALTADSPEIHSALTELDAAIAEWVAALAVLRDAGIDIRKAAKAAKAAAPAKLLSGQSLRGRRKGTEPVEAVSEPPPPIDAPPPPEAVTDPPPAAPDGEPAAGITSEDEAFLAKLSAEDATAIRVRRRLTGRSVQELAAELNVKPVAPKGKQSRSGKDTGRKAWWRNEE